MPATDLPTDRLDCLARQAATRVFREMVDEEIEFSRDADIHGDDDIDLFGQSSLPNGAFFCIIVGFVGDAEGKVMISLPRAAAESFALKLFDTPSLEWLGEDPVECLSDALGELGNMLAGLFKGGLTKWFPSLMLTTPKVLFGKRQRLQESGMTFRKQYLFRGFGGDLLVDVSWA